MKELFKKKQWMIAITLVIALLVGGVTIVSAVTGHASAKTSSTADESAAASGSISLPGNALADTLRNRSRWLYDLMTLSGKAQPENSSNPQKLFEEAQACGILSRYTEKEMYAPLDRLFVAQTTVKALGYKNRSAGYLADITSAQSDMATMAYYGYFLPDINFMVHPDAQITAEEYDSLLDELSRYRLLQGKTVLSFGDSIMYGSGNDGAGIADMIAEKYGMTAADYSVPGASMGVRAGRGHIIDQLKRAAADKIKPDIILLNGGTNDMNHVEFGKLTDGFDMTKTSDKDFTGGFEKTMWTLKNNWSGVPVVYVRVHNMNLGSDENERKYGERALEIAAKWGAASVDLYTDTDMNTEDPATCNRYTFMDADAGYICDSIHPNAVGYAKFYLPLISEAVVDQFQSEE